ncbi:phosphate acetyltransferase [Microbacteriaceae bacterium SG_E_30_P1]|uniref:Phosphate acetyltransferase n=1 Tax=Antiquaquibacter oligotrophicus TaxID=2880260 RepID=A0ABT6KPH0_9MICO|nr:phosphate acetyltransferase [Antiquaquibacter oligotrophicus]MDH6181891.1 phosphate acetyltransferase [Antiquaquibacter oligotrophicus]UDF12436.1 phosphate acetyltransferase [Antiquaquibacter oligotrophicus]
MARSIYITSAEGHSGKSSVALGVLDTLLRSGERVGVFRPIARSTVEPDFVLELLLSRDGVDLNYDDCIGTTYEAVHDDPEAALSTIVERFKAVESRVDSVVVIGSDFTDVASPTELAYNARIAANLGTPVLLVLTGREPDGVQARTADELRQVTELALPELTNAYASLLAIVVNRADPELLEGIVDTVAHATQVPVWAVPEDALLVAPTMRQLMTAVEGALLQGDEVLLSRDALGVVIAAMSMENVLPRLVEGGVVIIPGDRSEMLVAALTAHASGTFPSLAGIILNGGFELSPVIMRLMEGLDQSLPIITTEFGTWQTAQRISQVRGQLTALSQRKIDTALALFETHVDGEHLIAALGAGQSTAVTPLMFEYTLLERARAAGKRIVLPEGGDDRILLAAGTLLARKVVELTILGDEQDVRARASALGVDLSAATVTSPFDPELRERFAQEYTRLRAHKGVTIEDARDIVTDVSYFGTMMVQLGLADGMVSGAMHTTAHTIRPAFEFIKTVEGVSVVSSVFFMALEDRVLVYGDCAVVPDPTSEQLADIAISAAATAQQFGIDPRIAMLSYSTGESGTGADVDKVRAATDLVRSRRPDLLVEGPIQYDAAADAAVARTKLPESQVAGRATVFIFPDLNTGNNTYKAVQRSSGAVAIGPVLQGLRKPVNDLSRGALVRDIVNTVAITAIQGAAS